MVSVYYTFQILKKSTEYYGYTEIVIILASYSWGTKEMAPPLTMFSQMLKQNKSEKLVQ